MNNPICIPGIAGSLRSGSTTIPRPVRRGHRRSFHGNLAGVGQGLVVLEAHLQKHDGLTNTIHKQD